MDYDLKILIDSEDIYINDSIAENLSRRNSFFKSIVDNSSLTIREMPDRFSKIVSEISESVNNPKNEREYMDYTGFIECIQLLATVSKAAIENCPDIDTVFHIKYE